MPSSRICTLRFPIAVAQNFLFQKSGSLRYEGIQAIDWPISEVA